MSDPLMEAIERLLPDPKDTSEIAEIKAMLRKAVLDETMSVADADMTPGARAYTAKLRKMLILN